MYLRAILLLTIMLTFLVAPDLAMAQANIFTPEAGDKSMVIMGAIFGGLGVFAGGADPFIDGILAFNGAVLTIGGVLVSYTILIGTIGTAHDGEMLGKKFSSAWVPIRTAAGTALVLPVIGGGYCVMQAIVGWLIVQGIGLADVVWGKFANSTDMKFLSSNGTISSTARVMGYDVFKIMYCKNMITQMNKDLRATDAGKLSISEQVGKATTFTGGIMYGASPEGNGLKENSCGKILYPESKEISVSSVFTNQAEMNAARTAISNAHKSATDSLISEMDSLTSQMVTSKTPATVAQIETVISKYQEKINSAAAGQVGKLSDFKTLASNMAKDGWFMAGAFYTKMAWYADVVHRATTNTPTTNTPSDSVFSNKLFQDEVQKYDSLMKAVSLKTGGSLTGGFGVNAETGVENSEGAETVFKKLFDPSIFTDTGYNAAEHPLMGLKRLGNTLLGIWAAGSAGLVVLSGMSGGWTTEIATQIATGGTFSAAKAVPALLSLFSGLLTFVLAGGIILSYVLPMMPFFLWFGATLGWIVMCIEAILAAPMWAVMHLSPHGDDMVGTGGQGYRLVLSLMLRPVLMIFGLIASFVIINVLGQILSEIFLGTFVIGQSDANFLIKFVGYTIVSPLLFGWTMFVLIKKSFSMIHVIPEEMLKWFGGTNSPQLGDFANTVGGEQGGAMAGAALMANQAKGLTSGATEQVVGNLRGDISQKTADAKAHEKSIQSAFGGNASKIQELQGGSLYDQQKFMGQYDAEKKSLGGEGSVGGEAFDQAFQNISASPEGSTMTTADKIGAAKSQALDKMFGTQDGQAAAAISKMTGGSLSGSKFNSLMSDFQNKSKTLARNEGITSEEANSRIGGALSDGLKNAFEMGPATPSSVKKSVQSEFAKLGLPEISSKPIGGGDAGGGEKLPSE